MTDRVQLDRRVVLVNALSTVGSKVIAISVLVWLQQYLLRRVPAEEYELYPVIVAVMMFVRIPTTVLTSGIARFVTEAYAKHDDRRVTEIVSSMIPVMAVGSTVLGGLGGIIVWQIDKVLTIDVAYLSQARLMMGLLVFDMVFHLVLMPLTVGFFVRQKFVLLSVIGLGEQVLRAALLFALLFGVSTQVQWVVVSSVVAAVSANLVMVLGSRRLVPTLRFEPALARLSAVREVISFGGWYLLGMIAHRLYTSTDVLILNKLSTASAVASYHVGALPDRRLKDLLTRGGGVVQPALTGMYGRNDHEGLRRVYLSGNRYYLWASLIVGALLIAYRREVTLLYVGQEYIAAAAVVALLSVKMMFANSNQMLSQVCVATNRIRGIMIFALFAQSANVVLTVFLVGRLELGAMGAALGTLLVSAAAQLCFLWPLAMKLLGLPFSRFVKETLIPGLTPGLFCYATCEALRIFVTFDTWLLLALGAGVGVVAYVIALWVVAPEQDRRSARSLSRGILNRVRQVAG